LESLDNAANLNRSFVLRQSPGFVKMSTSILWKNLILPNKLVSKTSVNIYSVDPQTKIVSTNQSSKLTKLWLLVSFLLLILNILGCLLRLYSLMGINLTFEKSNTIRFFGTLLIAIVLANSLAPASVTTFQWAVFPPVLNDLGLQKCVSCK